MTVAVLSPTTEYAERVVAGNIVAGRAVRLACKRHIDDLKRAEIDPEWGYWFDPDEEEKAIAFFETVLTLPEGDSDDGEPQPFKLELFQKFKTGCLMGWKGADGYRRFRTAYIEEGKGNGKTPWAAGMGHYGLTADREDAPQIFAAAVTRDQAKILFSDAEKMTNRSPDLSDLLEMTVNNIANPKNQGFFRAISSEGKSLDGKRVHMALIDEIHEHPNATVVDKMRAGTKRRRQALIIEITNSGFDRNSVCYQHRVYSMQVLEGVLIDDTWFAYICELDHCDEHSVPNASCENCDDWTDEAVWPKVNPGLGTILPYKYLREQVTEARGMPSKLNIVLRLNFCIWTEQANRWLPMDRYDACSGKVDPYKLRSREAWMGVDLSSKVDLTSVSLVFEPDADDVVDILPYFWIPETRMRERSQRDRVPYDVWVRDGFIECTEGEVVDQEALLKSMLEIGKMYHIREVAVDPWNATWITTKLQDAGFVVVETRQGFATLSDASKELEKRIMAGTIRHGGNPVLRWNAANVAIRTDPAGNIKPDKEASTERIDGIAATINAMSRLCVEGGEPPSRYAQGGGLRRL